MRTIHFSKEGIILETCLTINEVEHVMENAEISNAEDFILCARGMFNRHVHFRELKPTLEIKL